MAEMSEVTNTTEAYDVQEWDAKRQEVINNPQGEYLGPYGFTPNDKEAMGKESLMLRPYRLYLLQHVVTLLNNAGVPWFITDGTLLGWYRSRSMIPHDLDIDASILEEDMLTIWKNRHQLPSDLQMTCNDIGRPGFQWCTEDSCAPFDPTQNSSKKLVIFHKNLPPKPSTGPVFYWEATMDLYTLRKEGNGYCSNFMSTGMKRVGFVYPENCIFPLQKSEFEGITCVSVPNDPVKWLEINYGYIGDDAVWDEETALYKPRNKAQS